MYTKQDNTTTSQCSNLLEGPVVVEGKSLPQVHCSTRGATDGYVPGVSNPYVQVPVIKVLKVLIQGDKILEGKWESVDVADKGKSHDRLATQVFQRIGMTEGTA